MITGCTANSKLAGGGVAANFWRPQQPTAFSPGRAKGAVIVVGMHHWGFLKATTGTGATATRAMISLTRVIDMVVPA
eukprot:scaffold50775_cov33-Phaeocystis_antarctica.AAC.3